MSKKILTYLVLYFFFCFAFSAMAQKKAASIWATVSFNKKTVMVGEPMVVTVSVYTSTWFTEPPVFSEIQVKGALMARLQDRTGAKMVSIGKKQYPVISKRYVIYPNIIGENVLPSFDVKVMSPPEGDFKGRERNISTKESKFNVLPPPEGLDISKWLSAYDLSISESWDRPLTNLKAGDILERRIVIKAVGALAAAIPPVEIEDMNFGSTYPKTPLLINRQNANSFTGSRTDIITYLIEKDGTFTIPEISVSWYHLRNQKIQTKSIASQELIVAPNPDLEFILSRQKALQDELAKEEIIEITKKEPFEFMGLNWWQLTIAVLTLISILRLVYFGFRKLQFQRSINRKQKLLSEEHFYLLFKEACKSENKRDTLRQLLFWYDRFRTNKYGPEFKDFVLKSGTKDLTEYLTSIEKEMFLDDQIDGAINSKEEFLKEITNARQRSNKEKKSKDSSIWLDLNPN